MRLFDSLCMAVCIKQDGESGQPCLVPWCSVKFCDVIPFVITRGRNVERNQIGKRTHPRLGESG